MELVERVAKRVKETAGAEWRTLHKAIKNGKLEGLIRRSKLSDKEKEILHLREGSRGKKYTHAEISKQLDTTPRGSSIREGIALSKLITQISRELILQNWINDPKSILNVSIDILNLDERTRFALRREKITTIGHLSGRPEKSISRGLWGRGTFKRMDHLKKELEKFNLYLNLNPEPREHHDSIDMLELSVRSRSCLHILRIKRISEIANVSRSVFLMYKNVGKETLRELEDVAGKFGVSFKKE